MYEGQGFTCASRDSAGFRSAHDVPVWRYRYFATWPNLELYPDSGAYHGSDRHMSFGAGEDVPGLPKTPAENQQIQYQMAAWGSFINNPETGPGSSESPWPEAREPNGLVALGVNNQPGATYVDPSTYDTLCEQMNGGVLQAQGAFRS